MPDKTKTKARRFSMPSVAFCNYWNKANEITDDSAWETFVYQCWTEFSIANKDMLNDSQDGWKTWGNDEVQSFLAEKCYAKATILRKKFAKLGKDIPMPKGYLNRGTEAKRVTTADLLSLFT